MPAYVVYEATIDDPERYEAYKRLASPAVAAGGGRFLTRGGAAESLEGESPARVVMIEFPTVEAALAWYHGEAYQAAKAVRETAGRARMFVVDGGIDTPV